MTRILALAGSLVLVVSTDAQAGPFGIRMRAAQLAPRSAQPAARFPRLAAIAQPPGPMLPGYDFPMADRFPALRGVSYGLSLALAVMAFFPPSYDVIGLGAPVAIRAAHVLLNGSPTPGRPLVTAGWVASPGAVQGIMWVRIRRTGIEPGIHYETNPPLTGSNRLRPFQGRFLMR